MARVLADALSEQTRGRPGRRTPLRPLRELARALGGWPAIGGLVTTAAAGVWMGLFPPAALSGAAGAVLGLGETQYLIDMAPETAFYLAEESSG